MCLRGRKWGPPTRWNTLSPRIKHLSSYVAGLSPFPCWQPGSFCCSQVTCFARHVRRLHFLVSLYILVHPRQRLLKKGRTHVNLSGQRNECTAASHIRSADIAVSQP